MRRHSLELSISIGIVVATAAVFWNVLGTAFVAWDDDINIYENKLITKLDGQHIAAMFLDVEQAMRYKPLSWFTWGTIYALSGHKPFAYHLANLLLHCGNAVLVFLTIRQLLLFSGGNGYSAAHRNPLLLCAGVGALLWAIHPLRVGPVAWATALPYDLALLFVLVSFLCYLQVDRADPKNKRILYWGSVLTFTLALLSYPIVLGFPLVLVVLDYYRSMQLNDGSVRWWNRAWCQIWFEKIPFLLASGLFTGIALYGRIRPAGTWAEAVPVEEFGLVSRAMQAFTFGRISSGSHILRPNCRRFTRHYCRFTRRTCRSWQAWPWLWACLSWCFGTEGSGQLRAHCGFVIWSCLYLCLV